MNKFSKEVKSKFIKLVKVTYSYHTPDIAS